jgi:hypothetical protein
MPTFVILATSDVALADVWERQLPAGRISVRLERQGLPTGMRSGLAAVVVLDAIWDSTLSPTIARCPTIFVGEPKTLAFEQARMAKRARVFLSYEESTTRLREFIPLVEEVAEKQSMIEMLSEKNRRTDYVRPELRSVASDPSELWDFLEASIENLDTRERLVAEFRRASRQILRASHAVFFLREGDGFRADRGTSFFAADDPMVAYFETHPLVLDGSNWDGPADPVAELAVRNRLAMWGARLLVPVHENGRLLGLIALGVRDDGQSYDQSDRMRAVFFARLLRQFLAKCAHLARLNHISGDVALGAKYLPATLVLGPAENAPRHVPLVVRDLIGRARKSHEVVRAAPGAAQPFRASAGIIAETGGVWAFWEEASGEVHDAMARDRLGRRELLRELALTLSHELGNALVSLAVFRQAGDQRPVPPPLVETMKADVAQLEVLNDNLALMQNLDVSEQSIIDIREVAQSVGKSVAVRVEVGPDPVVLTGSRMLLEFALRALICAVAENRSEESSNDLSLKVRSTGSGSNVTALLSLRGKNLELEGILPEPAVNAVPNQGRLGVFLAKEIVRLHHGEIHSGPGMECVEILISLRTA